MKKQDTIEQAYNITIAFITDQDTSMLKSNTINFIKTFPGRSYLLTIDAPSDGISHISNNVIPAQTPEYNQVIARGPHGTIKLYCNGRLIKTYTSVHPVAPYMLETDNFIKRFIRKRLEKDFFNLLRFIKQREMGRVILRDNNKVIQTKLSEISGKVK